MIICFYRIWKCLSLRKIRSLHWDVEFSLTKKTDPEAIIVMKNKALRSLRRFWFLLNSNSIIKNVKFAGEKCKVRRIGVLGCIVLPNIVKQGNFFEIVFTLEIKNQLSKEIVLLPENCWLPTINPFSTVIPLKLKVRAPISFEVFSAGKREKVEVSPEENVYFFESLIPCLSPCLVSGEFVPSCNKETERHKLFLYVHKEESKQFSYNNCRELLNFSYKVVRFYGQVFKQKFSSEYYILATSTIREAHGMHTLMLLPISKLSHLHNMKEDEKLEWVAGLAHEISHSYWGFQVFSDMLLSPWLSEGFAEFSALIALRKFLGKDKLIQYLKWGLKHHRQGRYRRKCIARVTSLDSDVWNVAYFHGALALWQLMVWLGEKTFLEVLTHWLQRYKNKLVGNKDFEQLIEFNIGKEKASKFLSLIHHRWEVKENDIIRLTKA